MSHVIYKLKPDLKSLREPQVLRVLEPAFRKAKAKEGFRIIAWSLLPDHVHLIVEGESTEEVAKGLQGLAVSLTKRLNKLWGRVGEDTVFRDRHRKIPIKDFRHARRAIPYVLGNAVRHGILEPGEIDPYSSARWWRWIIGAPIRRPLRDAPVAESRYLYSLCGNPVYFDPSHRPGSGAGSRLRLDFENMRVVSDSELSGSLEYDDPERAGIRSAS
jgi:REP element-mobilizing transposase RayT